MKFVLLSLCLLCLYSCKQEQLGSLESIKIDYTGSIPYLMTEMNIDSVAEIITYGKYSSANTKDTFNLYVLKENKIVHQRMKSMMCCDYTYQYNSLGILSKTSMFSDYYTDYKFSYDTNGNGIKVLEDNNFNDSKEHFYEVENNLLVMKTSTHKVDDSYNKTVKYFYNANNQLVKKHSEAKNHPGGEFDYNVTLNSYDWNDSILKETRSKQLYNDGQEFYETITIYDDSGFPKARAITNNKDTICKTVIVKIKQTQS